MKKILAFLLSLAVVVTFSGCNNDAASSEAIGSESSSSSETVSLPEDARILIAYFSWADNAENVQQLAGWVQEETGGDLFSIRVTEPYPSDWDACLDRANEERGQDARPALAENVRNIDDYDVVFLGYPNWWYGVPMALLTFLEENDLSGKQVYLFCSHGTGGLADSVDIISEALPDATISDNIFDCNEEDAANSQADIQRWVTELGF